jgi:PIN domain nuclease of toxin-antitoxin system
MTVLLDSHAFIWWLSSPDRLSKVARQAIESTKACVSAVTAYELGIKFATGRLLEFDSLDIGFEDQCRRQGLGLISIDVSHALAASRLPIIHRDPFDRLLAAQSIVENMPLVTLDPAFTPFGCNTIW